MDNYGMHMFTEAVRAEQGSAMAEQFDAMYRNRFTDGFDADAKAFVESRTSFYMASVGETGWPYVQHRGGKPGFLRFLDDTTLGFADYKGNKQLISKGNLRGNNRVSLFLMDYARQARMKIIGHAEMFLAREDTKLADRLRATNEEPIERLVKINVVAFDWNCPKYIEPRYTEDEVSALVAPHLAKRDRMIEAMSARLRELGEDPDALVE